MSCNVWLRLTWGLHRQTTRQPKRRFLVAVAGPILLHGDVSFNVTPRGPRPVIGDPVLFVRWQYCL
jgi:hypothetical protein